MEKNALQGLQLEILKALLTLQTHPNTSKHTIHSHDVLLATTAGTVEAPNFSQLLGICEPSR